LEQALSTNIQIISDKDMFFGELNNSENKTESEIFITHQNNNHFNPVVKIECKKVDSKTSVSSEMELNKNEVPNKLNDNIEKKDCKFRRTNKKKKRKVTEIKRI
jgi:hypothetical protein